MALNLALLVTIIIKLFLKICSYIAFIKPNNLKTVI